MARSSTTDDALVALEGVEIASNHVRGVVYRVERMVGEGGMAFAFYAIRYAPEGKCPVVIKVLRPWLVKQHGGTVALSVLKEAVALGRLAEHVPPTPFVVRLVEVGYVPVTVLGEQLSLPWLALEYVHGGALGTTLTERVASSITASGSAFGPGRAALAVECLCRGLSAVHAVGVLHRDIKPDNVLCCGFGDNEIFKVADFGVARPAGLPSTFGAAALGTPGYAAPELILLDHRNVSRSTDVFSLAAVVFFLLTGERYFPIRSASEIIAQIRSSIRRSIRASRYLCPELQHNPSACQAIDQALLRATTATPKDRIDDAQVLSALIIPWLRGNADERQSLFRRAELIHSRLTPERIPGWSWISRQEPEADLVVRSVAWDGDARCMAITNRGLSFWNGTRWRDAPFDALRDLGAPRFVRRLGAGRWLVGCHVSTLALFAADGGCAVVHLDDPAFEMQTFSGDPDDLGIVVGRAEGALVLRPLVRRRLLKALPLHGVACVTSVSQISDESWLIAGRTDLGAGFVAKYVPLEWYFEAFPVPSVRAFIACGGHPDCRVGIVGGADGFVMYHDESATWAESVEGVADISAAAVDAAGSCWTAGLGRIWHRQATGGAPGDWSCVWEEPSWSAPVVSLFADLGLIVAVTADGGIVEGRAIELELGTDPETKCVGPDAFARRIDLDAECTGSMLIAPKAL